MSFIIEIYLNEFLDEVAVIDEIQMMKDPQRGWAWTRALLGLMAEEIHLCGEAGTIDLISQLCLTTNENIEVRNYKRLTNLYVEDSALGMYLNRAISYFVTHSFNVL